jgi:hypothetical protein
MLTFGLPPAPILLRFLNVLCDVLSLGGIICLKFVPNCAKIARFVEIVFMPSYEAEA